jgi:DNA modification methylase
MSVQMTTTTTTTGNIWLLGNHRVMCGDSTNPDDVAKLMNNSTAALMHADPPYGMGKESDGIANDNLYDASLDAFQMKWWKAFRPHLNNNASAYIWGNAAELWRLWYVGGLSESERLTFRNEIVWAKGSAGAGGISHQGAKGLRLYPQSTERCLFFMLGEQGNNNNANGYWDKWEPIRMYIKANVEMMYQHGWTRKRIDTELFGCTPTSGGMISHYTGISQWAFVTEENYTKLQHAADGKAFTRSYAELKQEFDATRSFFDNTHDKMMDVWTYGRVSGKDRHGHATPKPVAMMERIMRSSLPDGGLCVEPFGGSGSTLMAAENTGRTCYTMELQPHYCDTIVRRWQESTGGIARLEGTGEAFREMQETLDTGESNE